MIASEKGTITQSIYVNKRGKFIYLSLTLLVNREELQKRRRGFGNSQNAQENEIEDQVPFGENM